MVARSGEGAVVGELRRRFLHRAFLQVNLNHARLSLSNLCNHMVETDMQIAVV